MPTDPVPYPLPKPACSISQAAGTLRPPGTSYDGISTPARSLAAAYSSAVSTALVKNEPTLRRLGSAGSSTMLLARRSSSTAARTSTERGTVADPDAESAGQLGVPDRRRQPAVVVQLRSVTSSTANRSWCRKTLVR